MALVTELETSYTDENSYNDRTYISTNINTSRRNMVTMLERALWRSWLWLYWVWVAGAMTAPAACTRGPRKVITFPNQHKRSQGNFQISSQLIALSSLALSSLALSSFALSS